MWLSEGRLAACAAFLYISIRSVLVYDSPHSGAPKADLHGGFRGLPGPLASVFSNGECWPDIGGRERGRSPLDSPGALPVFSLQAGRPLGSAKVALSM